MEILAGESEHRPQSNHLKFFVPTSKSKAKQSETRPAQTSTIFVAIICRRRKGEVIKMAKRVSILGTGAPRQGAPKTGLHKGGAIAKHKAGTIEGGYWHSGAVRTHRAIGGGVAGCGTHSPRIFP